MIKIVTDSSAGLPEDMLEAYDIRLVSACLTFGAGIVREHVDLPTDQFYAFLAGHPAEIPRPICPPVSEFVRVYDQLMADAPTADIVSIHISGAMDAGLGGTLVSARKSLDHYPGFSLQVFDSRSCLLGEGLMALQAARLAQEGATLEAVLAQLELMREQMQLVCVVDTSPLGGPVWRTVYPPDHDSRRYGIVALHQGMFEPQGRYADRAAALAALRERVPTDSGRAGIQAGVMHGACPDEARWLADTLYDTRHCQTLLVSEISPSLGVLLGLGALGVCWCAMPSSA